MPTTQSLLVSVFRWLPVASVDLMKHSGADSRESQVSFINPIYWTSGTIAAE